MCGPAIGLVGALVSGAGSLMAANAQSASFKAQQKLNERQSEIEREKGAFEVSQIDRNVKRVIGRQATAFAKSGINLSSGSVIDVAADTLTEGNIDKSAALYGARIKSDNFAVQAQIDGINAGQARTAGIIGAITPIINAVGTNISNGSQFLIPGAA